MDLRTNKNKKNFNETLLELKKIHMVGFMIVSAFRCFEKPGPEDFCTDENAPPGYYPLASPFPKVVQYNSRESDSL